MKTSSPRAGTHLSGHCSKLHKRQVGAKTVTWVDALEQGAAHSAALKSTPRPRQVIQEGGGWQLKFWL